MSCEPRSFAAVFDSSRVILVFPLILNATEPKPIMVQNFRLTFPERPDNSPTLSWQSTQSELGRSATFKREMSAPFAVQGRQADRHILEFSGLAHDLESDLKDHTIRIEVKVAHHEKWDTLLEFILHAGHFMSAKQFVVHSNLCGNDIQAHNLLKH